MRLFVLNSVFALWRGLLIFVNVHDISIVKEWEVALIYSLLLDLFLLLSLYLIVSLSDIFKYDPLSYV
jgi:hypothetical protein